MRLAVAVLAASVLLACGGQDAQISFENDDLDTADAPLLGADGKDTADRACNVILRTARRTPKNGGFETKCSTAGCFVVWTGWLELSVQAVAEGAKPYVLVKNIDAARWTKVAATKTTGATAGFVRYSFRLDKNTLPDGLSSTGLARAKVELSPYVLSKSGARVFDHNRRTGDFDTYVLSAATGWDLSDDPAVCQPPADVQPTLTFETGWRHEQHGTLVAGGQATVEYPLERLPQCRGTHNGYPAWDVRASVRLLPSGQVLEGTVRGFDSPGGTPSNAGAKAVPFTFPLPNGTTGLEVWFHNFSGAGMSCDTWDSNLGQNYRFTVEPRAAPAPTWAGNVGSSLARDCLRKDGVPEPITLDSYVMERACSFVELDVYAPGLTDGRATKPEALLAQVDLALDGKPLPSQWLSFTSRAGNDYRFHFEVPRTALYYGPKWQTLSYTMRFSSDGRAWLKDVTRTVVRDPTFVNPAWP